MEWIKRHPILSIIIVILIIDIIYYIANPDELKNNSKYGFHYEKDKVITDPNEALDYHLHFCKEKTGVDQGHACFNYARLIENTDKNAAITNYIISCERSIKEACFELGRIYSYGNGVQKDIQKGITYLKDACEGFGGLGEACNILSAVLQLETNDIHAAATYANKACDRKYADGCTVAALHYIEGKAVPVDINKALKLSKKGCELGSEQSCTVYKTIMLNK